MAKELGTRRIYVNKAAYLKGNRIVKTDDEMTTKEKEQFRTNFTDYLLRAFGFVKKSEVENNNAGWKVEKITKRLVLQNKPLKPLIQGKKYIQLIIL